MLGKAFAKASKANSKQQTSMTWMRDKRWKGSEHSTTMMKGASAYQQTPEPLEVSKRPQRPACQNHKTPRMNKHETMVKHPPKTTTMTTKHPPV
jgi:hypothetical protein